ncbi:MAG: HAD hydrolase-like protein [Acidobacteria bacterium]|nr:HAD hydrolase-like protein [Acidobacteriota bacterium]
MFHLESNRELDAVFGASVPHWPAFPDSADRLRLLSRYYKLVILSNVDRDGIAASTRKLGVEFDAVYIAQDIGSYKPADANFSYLLNRLKSDFGLERSEVLHVAQSLYHDHAPANRFGIATAWIDRQRLSEGGSWGATEPMESIPSTDFVYFSIGEMAEAVAAERGRGEWRAKSGEGLVAGRSPVFDDDTDHTGPNKGKDAGGTPALPGGSSRWCGGAYPAGNFSESRRAPFGKLPFVREPGRAVRIKPECDNQ